MAYCLSSLFGLCWPWSNGKTSNSILDDIERYYQQEEDLVAAEFNDQILRNALSKNCPHQSQVMSPTCSRNYGSIHTS
ncbi:hypothetical protein PG988_001927 [Apiospora saccharicola]